MARSDCWLNYDVKNVASEDIAGSDEFVPGNWRKSNMAGNLAEL